MPAIDAAMIGKPSREMCGIISMRRSSVGLEDRQIPKGAVEPIPQIRSTQSAVVKTALDWKEI